MLALCMLFLGLKVAVASAQAPDQDIGNLLLSLFGNTAVFVTFLIELLLGIGLGYFSVKILKYLLALVGIIIVGMFLNLWQLSQLMQSLRERLSIDWSKLLAVAQFLLYAIGLTTILPLCLGFFLGVIIAMLR